MQVSQVLRESGPISLQHRIEPSWRIAWRNFGPIHPEDTQEKGDLMSSTSPKPRVPAARFYFLCLLYLSLSFTSSLPAQEHMANLGTRHFELSMEMIPTSDGNYVTVAPVIRSSFPTAGPSVKIYLNKVDENSNVIWSRTIARFPDGQHVPLSVVEMHDAAGSAIGYAVTGFDFQFGNQDPIFVVTTDLNGHVTNYRTFGGFLPIAGANITPTAGVGNKIIQNLQGDLVIVGSVLLIDNVGVVPFLLNVDTNLNLQFMRLYHDARYVNNLFGFGSMANFDDIVAIPAMDDPQTGQLIPEGYLITGGTKPMGVPNSAETLVVRTDLGGTPLAAGIYGPLDTDPAESKGRAIELASNGLVKVVSHVTDPTGAPLTTQIFTLTAANLNLLHQVRYYGFISHGDIRETMNGEFILAGRGAWDKEGAVLRVKNNGNIVFYFGYGSTNVELLTDVHELYDGTLYSSGVTTTWCRGPADEYLVRTKPDGTLPGCPVLSLNIDILNPQDPMRDTGWLTEQLTVSNSHEVIDITPDTVKRHICPGPIVVPVPWDWFVRADYTRDLQVNVADAIGSLSRLFSGGPESIPANAADSNGDGTHDVSDVIHTLTYLFSNGPAPAAPFGEIGPDPNAEEPNIFDVDQFFTYFGINARNGETQSDLNFDLEVE